MKNKKTREEYLEKCADVLCRSLYKLCKDNCTGKTKEEQPDIKLLKETCSAVKEAAALISGLEKNSPDPCDTLKIIFSEEKYCE